MNGKGEVVLLENGTRTPVDGGFFRNPRVSGTHTVKSAKRFIKLKDTAACLVFMWKAWGGSGYGSKQTRVLHKWNIGSVLSRAGIR